MSLHRRCTLVASDHQNDHSTAPHHPFRVVPTRCLRTLFQSFLLRAQVHVSPCEFSTHSLSLRFSLGVKTPILPLPFAPRFYSSHLTLFSFSKLVSLSEIKFFLAMLLSLVSFFLILVCSLRCFFYSNFCFQFLYVWIQTRPLSWLLQFFNL